LLDRWLLSPGELLAVLAPEGWNNSPLLRCYHPTPEQRRREAAAFRENLTWWSRLTAPRRAEDEILVSEPGEDTLPVDPEREVVDLVGLVLWDVFSDNHTVFDPDGAFHLGSFRGAAGFLAEEMNVRYRQWGIGRDYMDLYMGTIWLSRRADLGPAYRWVFAGLREGGCDWRYAFPRLSLVSFAEDGEPADGVGDDPSAAIAAELEAADRERERAELQERLDAAHTEAVTEALRQPPPTIVRAYHDVYRVWPRGWPPARIGT
jgi:hypothetical protein